MKSLCSHLAIVTLLGVPSLGLGPRIAAQDSEELYAKVVNSCVFIVTPMNGGFGMGSGALIDVEKRLVITNYHVVMDRDWVYAQFPRYVKGVLDTNKKTYLENPMAGLAIKAKVLYRDTSRDLALIELEKLPPGTPAIPLAKTSPRRAATVWNIGSPAAVEQVFSVTEGKVRAVGIEEHVVSAPGGANAFRVKARFVTATNPTNPGDSGGPLFDKKGHLVAVTESGNAKAQQVNLFVDVTEVRAFLAEKNITIKELGDASPPVKLNVSGIPGSPPGATDSTPPDKDPANSAPALADEKAAAQLLLQAKLFKNSDDKEYYANKLNLVIDKYPGTIAAKEARKLLDGM